MTSDEFYSYNVERKNKDQSYDTERFPGIRNFKHFTYHKYFLAKVVVLAVNRFVDKLAMSLDFVHTVPGRKQCLPGCG